MVLLTEHARAEVLGTRFLLRAEDAKTRLEVDEGKVNLKRLSDGESLDVPMGHCAEVGAGIELVLQRIAGEALPVPAAATRVLFADEFEDSPLGQWPKGWQKHPTEPERRSGFAVVVGPGQGGNQMISVPSSDGRLTQHARIPVSVWPNSFEVSFRMRLSGKDNIRSGMEFYDERNTVPSIEYNSSDSTISLLERRPVIREVKKLPLLLEVGQWHEWKITVKGNHFSLVIDGEPIAEMMARCGRVENAMVISRGRDGVDYDDVRVVVPATR
jgi:hypothetical protein